MVLQSSSAKRFFATTSAQEQKPGFLVQYSHLWGRMETTMLIIKRKGDGGERKHREDLAFQLVYIPYFRPSTIILSLLAILFLIALCRDGLSEPEEELPPAVLEEKEPVSPSTFNTEDLKDWQRRPGRLSPAYSKQPDAADYTSETSRGPDPDTRIAIASMPWGESVHPVYDDAIATLEKYAQRHGYKTFLLRQGITSSCRGLPVDCNPIDRKNLGGAWNKLLFLLQIVTQELTKPENDRLEWI
ncbi:MAG: hypothetical protein Q9195_007020, partial [Heterodermia aff. obscurata]